MNVTFWPTFGVALSTLKIVTRSALVTFILAESTSPAVIKSTWSPLAAVVDPVMVCPPWFESTDAVIFNWEVAPSFIAPIVHKPVVVL